MLIFFSAHFNARDDGTEKGSCDRRGTCCTLIRLGSLHQPALGVAHAHARVPYLVLWTTCITQQLKYIRQ